MSALLTFLLLAAGFTDPGIPNGERVVYLGYDQGTTREIIHEIYDNGNSYYSVHKHIDTTKIIVKCWVHASDLSTVKVIKDRSGRFQLGVEPVEGGILVSDGFKGNESMLKHDGRFYDRHTLIEAFRGFPFDEPETIEFGFFESNLGMVITGTCTYGGIHTIQTDAGEFRCHKLTLGFKSKLVETVYRMLLAGRGFDFYYEVRDPHRMIYWTDNKDGYMKLIRIEAKGNERKLGDHRSLAFCFARGGEHPAFGESGGDDALGGREMHRAAQPRLLRTRSDVSYPPGGGRMADGYPAAICAVDRASLLKKGPRPSLQSRT